MSRLAIVAIILSAVPCCPLVSLVGAALGVTAWRRIHASKGAIRGGRLAAWAVLIGAAMGAISFAAMSGVASWVERTNRDIMVEQIGTTISASIDGNSARVHGVWDTASKSALTADDIQQFGQSINDRYGALVRFTISSVVTTGSFLQPQYEIAGIFVFERGERIGSAQFQVRSSTVELWPQFRLKSLLIEDHDRGDLRLPAVPAGAPATPQTPLLPHT